MAINVASTLQNPESEFGVEIQNRTFPTQSFNSSEARKFEQQLNSIISPHTDSIYHGLFQEKAQAIALTAAFAKQHFDGKIFGGLNPGDNEVGFEILRPGHITSDPADGAVTNDWFHDPPGAGWNDWIGDGGDNNRTLDDTQVVLILGLADQAEDTSISGYNVQQFGRNVDMVPKDLTHFKQPVNERSQYITPLPTMVAQENDSIHLRLRHDRDLESQPRLLGFTFGLGTYMNNEDY